MFPLVGLAASSLAAMMYVSKKKTQKEDKDKKEGFEYKIPLSNETKRVFDKEGQNLIETNAANYSAIMNTVNPITNPNFLNNKTVLAMENVLQNAVPNVSRSADGRIGVTVNNDVLLPPVENTVTDYVRRCEAVTGISASAFDDPWFASHCGICHDGGANNAGEPHIGGLYNDPASIPATDYNARRMGRKRPDYQPSIGTCKPGKFSVTKAQAERIIYQLECEKKQNYDVPGCAQCVDDERFYYVSSDTDKEPISIVVAGLGSLIFSSGGKVVNRTLSKSPQTITPEIPLKEGDVVYMAVSGPSDAIKPELSAYIYAKTITGEYRMDILRLVDVDLETGSKPRFAGINEMNKEFYNILRPGSKKSALNLQVNIPYTYIEPNQIEAQQCGSAPFLTTADSAEKLSSGPCFVKGSKPGNYSLECIQQIFDSAGCGPAGKGYPTTLEQARTWAKNDTIGLLAGNVYGASLRADSGMDGGRKLTLPERHESAQFCNGRSYLTVCDAYDKENGPLGEDCLDYLYKGQIDGGCQPEGILAPIRPDGTVSEEAVTKARLAGGVEGVKAYYRSIYAHATNNGLKDDQREYEVKQCFGTGFVKGRVDAAPQILGKSTVLTSPTANQKTAFERINNDYPYGGNFSPVAVLGRYGMAPWGSGGGFSDPSAYWIWNMYGAEINSPVYQNKNTTGQDRNVPAFYYIYDNRTTSVIRARIDFMIDNIGDLYVNGDTIAQGHTGGWDGSWRATANSIGNQKFVSLKPGRNMIKFVANNQGGPAGFLLACFGPDEKLLFHTDGSWFFRDAYN